MITSWGAFVMPKGTPPAIVNKLSRTIKEIASEPAMQQHFLELGGRAVSSTPEELSAFAEKERAKFKEAVHLSGAKME